MEPTTAGLAAKTAPTTFRQGVLDSLPIVIGYLPVAFAFGLNSVKLGFTPLEGLFISCIIYAGSSQFVITTLLNAGVSLWLAGRANGNGHGRPSFTLRTGATATYSWRAVAT